MHHVVAFTTAVGAAAVTQQAMPGIADGVIPQSLAGNYLFQDDGQIKIAYAKGLSLSRARINTPSYRRVAIPEVQPVDQQALGAYNSPPSIDFYGDFPITYAKLDELNMDVTTTGAVASQYHGAVWWFPNVVNPIPPGPVYTIHATAAIAGIVNAWARGTLTIDQPLPAGSYAVVGLDAIGAGLVIARLRFPNQVYLPGCRARVAVTNFPDFRFRFGRLGLWGSFANTAPPTLEIYCDAASAAQDVWIDVIPLGNVPIPPG